jgi:hypothetical protein
MNSLFSPPRSTDNSLNSHASNPRSKTHIPASQGSCYRSGTYKRTLDLTAAGCAVICHSSNFPYIFQLLPNSIFVMRRQARDAQIAAPASESARPTKIIIGMPRPRRDNPDPDDQHSHGTSAASFGDITCACACSHANATAKIQHR